VTSGSNARRCRDGYLCLAGVGYDGPTGLGTPIGITGFAGGTSGGGGTTNAPPTASFTSSCTDLTCTFTDASTDTDGTIASWSWTFGDGTTSSAQNPSHTFGSSNTYPVTLTVTDNGGATGTTTNNVTVSSSTTGISLTATGYKVKGRNTVDLTWSGSSSVHVYRNGTPIATASGSSYTDSTGDRGGATYGYQVCDTGTGTCSNTVTVVF
jgi:PKD repeat protein